MGTHSNMEIAREMNTKKKAHNVKGYKLHFLRPLQLAKRVYPPE